LLNQEQNQKDRKDNEVIFSFAFHAAAPPFSILVRMSIELAEAFS